MLGFGNGVLPLPDGSFSQGDRQTFLGLFSGLLAGLPIVSTRRTLKVINIIEDVVIDVVEPVN